MQKIFEAILDNQLREWKETKEHQEQNELLTKKLESLNAYTGEVESLISCYGAQCVDDGVTIGFIIACELFRELADFKSRYAK